MLPACIVGDSVEKISSSTASTNDLVSSAIVFAKWSSAYSLINLWTKWIDGQRRAVDAFELYRESLKKVAFKDQVGGLRVDLLRVHLLPEFLGPVRKQ